VLETNIEAANATAPNFLNINPLHASANCELRVTTRNPLGSTNSPPKPLPPCNNVQWLCYRQSPEKPSKKSRLDIGNINSQRPICDSPERYRHTWTVSPLRFNSKRHLFLLFKASKGLALTHQNIQRPTTTNRIASPHLRQLDHQGRRRGRQLTKVGENFQRPDKAQSNRYPIRVSTALTALPGRLPRLPADRRPEWCRR